MNIGEVLMQLRKEKKMTRIVVARSADIQENTLYLIEKGHTLPRVETLNNLCAVLGVSLNYVLLLCLSDVKTKTPELQSAFDALFSEMKKILEK